MVNQYFIRLWIGYIRMSMPICLTLWTFSKKMRLINYAIENIKGEKILLEVVEMLLAFGADPRAREGECDMTPVMFAIVHGYQDVINYLIKIPGVLSDKNDDNTTILMMVAASGRDYVLEQLLKNWDNIEDVNDSGATALVLAICTGKEGAVRILLKAGANFETKGGEEMLTPLMCASIEGHLEIVDILPKAGANPNVKSKSDWTALIFAADKDCGEIVERLLEESPDLGDLNLALTYAFDDYDMAKKLLSAGADPNTIMRNTESRRHLSSKFMSAWYDFDDDREPVDGTTTLMWASRKGHEDVVEQLLEAGANINAKNDDGMTALMMAKRGGHEKIVGRLLEAGADIIGIDQEEKLPESPLWH